MNQVVRKWIWDFEKEENWLNTMSAKGMAFIDYSWGRYVFRKSPDNEYTYRIQLLENVATHPESIAYIKFLEENGVECVSTYSRWIYLRKKSSEGVFNIYSDLESKIKHYKRINVGWNTLMWVELTIGLLNLVIGLMNISYVNGIGSMLNFIMGGLTLMVGIVCLIVGLPLRKKIKTLQQENLIRE